VLDYFDNTWALTDMLFSSFQHEDAFVQPPPHHLRHPMAFYYGHPTCFYVNKCRLAGLLDGPVDAYYEDLFQVGVDEMRWDDMSKNEKEWPLVDDVQAYRRTVYELIKGLILSHPDLEDGHGPITATSQSWALFMGMEHERIHLETSSVLMQEHAVDNFVKPALFPDVHPSAHGRLPAKTPVEGVDFPANRMIAVAGGDVRLGKPLDFPSYGWDNEYGAKTVSVGPFAASSQLVSNGEFWQFVKDSGYLAQTHWSTTGWAWRAFRNTKWPQFWRAAGPQGSHEYTLRTIFDEIPMQWDWPVQVNYHEAQAYCRWKNAKDGNAATEYYHVITEPMHQLLRDAGDRSESPTDDDAILRLSAGTTSATAHGRNTNLSHGSFSPVDAMATNAQGFHDVFGNAWQWCEDHMSALPGFAVHPIYDDFTVPCFDGEHHVIMGGSYMSSGDNGASKFARYHFRPHFFQHAGFRVVSSPIQHDSVVEVVTSCLNAPLPHAVVAPFRASPQVFVHRAPASIFLERLEQQAATQWRDFSAGQEAPVVHVDASTSSSAVSDAVAQGSLLLVVEDIEVGDGWTLVKEGLLPKIEKDAADGNVRRVVMTKVALWQPKTM
ncbi:hypothetical protein As57867_015285, partial [Aphanomyces stellatus]